ncbi:MAG: hypothetical protein V1874_14785 [Spirochaetota bacterium]
MNDIQAFNKLLIKFRFTEEIPEHVQQHVSGSQKKALVSSLKKLGASGLVYSFILLIYFGFRKKGYGLSLSFSKAIAWASITAAGISAAGGASYLAYNMAKGQTMKQQTTGENTGSAKGFSLVQKYRLGIGRLMSRNNDSELSERVTDLIANELVELLGHDYVIKLDNERKGKKVNLILVGAVGKLGHELIISSKIIDVENSQVLFAENVQVPGETDIEPQARYLSQNIAKYLKQKFEE